MAAPLQIEDCLTDAVHAHIVQSNCGLLIGCFCAVDQYGSGSKITILDALHLQDVQTGIQENLLPVVQGLLPQGLQFVGVYAATKDDAELLLKQSCVQRLFSNLPNEVAGRQLVATHSPASQPLEYSLRADSRQTPLEVQTRPNEGYSWLSEQSRALCSAYVSLPLDIYTPQSTTGEEAANLQTAVQAAQKAAEQKLAETTHFIATLQAGKQVLLSPSTAGSLQEAVGSITTSTTAVAMTAEPLQAPAADNGPASSPVYRYQVAGIDGITHTRIALHLHCLCYIPSNTQLCKTASGYLLPGLLQQLHSACAVLTQQKSLSVVRAYHFLPPGRSHHVTLVYLDGKAVSSDASESHHLALRKSLHSLLGLPSNRPLLRTANAVPLEGPASSPAQTQSASVPATLRLRDVHQGLSNPVQGGVITMIDGTYEYYHYMQDRFNDSGWGCAYRSLQTLVSWFRLQQYTNKASPSHREMQEILVKLGDKTPDFIGSSQWIGAIELSYILDDYLGVTSKIITVNRGAEIPSHARQLAAHFTTQGTPVMIGGGVLAYTLLGISFNDQTGECAFLILDPHYTGGEDLRKIQSGTWIGWKKPGDTAAAGGPLFAQDAFYNFLCPQRPQEV